MSSGMFLSYGDMPRMTDFDLQNGASLGDTTPSKANKMSEIPDDIWKVARSLAKNAGWSQTQDKILIAEAIWEERQRCAKIAADEAEYAMATYEGARLHDFLSVSRHIEAQIMLRPHQRDKMRGISYPYQAILNQTEE